MLPEIKEIVKCARMRRAFRPTTVTLDAKTARLFVAMRTDPRRFTPKIFEGEWGLSDDLARPDAMHLLATVVCPDQVVRVLGRQDGRLFAMTSAKPQRGK
jgi:hypothetical protein